MSIVAQVLDQCEKGNLVRVEPLLKRPGQVEVRTLFVSPRLWAMLIGPWESAAQEDRWGRIRNDLDQFILGKLTTVRVTKNAPAEMARLCPPEDEVWEILSKTPRPSLRLFGSFVAKNQFLALTYAERAPLGKKGSQAWKDVLTDFRADRKKILYELEPYSGAIVPDDYLSKGVPR